MKTTRIYSFLMPILVITAILVSAASALAQAQVTCELDHDEITLGDSAQLTMTVTGGEGDNISPPTVPGLEFVSVGQSTQIQIINGSMTSSTSLTYQINPEHAGTFTIPSLSKGGQPLTLRVLPAGGGTAPSTGNSNPSSNLPPPTSSGLSGESIHPTPDGAAFVHLGLPKLNLYVGETVPVDIQVGLKPGLVAAINDLPTLNADSLALNQLSAKPEQTEEVIEGRNYTVLTWHSALTALKPGSFSVTVDTPLTVRMRTKLRRPSSMPGGLFDDPFADPFFQDFFGGTTEKQITVSSDPEGLTVLALPNEGKPSGFGGAVGSFNVNSELSPVKGERGDPVTLRLKISGTGDFDRVNSSMLGDLKGWKTYRPNAKFVPSDSVGFSGEKDIEQAIIPQEPGRQNVPALTFSYFNPETKRYETKQTVPLTLEVTDTSAKSLAAAQTPVDKPAQDLSDDKQPDDLRPNQVETGKTVSTLQPLYFQPGFLAGQLALVLGFLGAGIWIRRGMRTANDPDEVRRHTAQRAIQQYLDEMSAAASTRDTKRFFQAARATIQEKLALRWNLAPAAITTAEINSHLNGDGAEICRLFAYADQVAYSGQEMTGEDFAQWSAIVQNELSHIDKL
jgi:hypothetical protein